MKLSFSPKWGYNSSVEWAIHFTNFATLFCLSSLISKPWIALNSVETLFGCIFCCQEGANTSALRLGIKVDECQQEDTAKLVGSRNYRWILLLVVSFKKDNNSYKFCISSEVISVLENWNAWLLCQVQNIENWFKGWRRVSTKWNTTIKWNFLLAWNGMKPREKNKSFNSLILHLILSSLIKNLELL